MSKTRFLIFITICLVAACATDESGLFDFEPIGHTYYPDCDRNLEVVQRDDDGKLRWSLSQVGCLHYEDGFVERPQFLPVDSTEFLFFSDNAGDSFQNCETTTKGLSVYADCPREGGLMYVGKLDQNGRVKISNSVAFNVVVKDGSSYRRFDHEEDEGHVLDEKGAIGFALRTE